MFRKVDTPEARHLADSCKVGYLYRCLADRIYPETIGDVRRMLDIRPEAFDQLFVWDAELAS